MTPRDHLSARPLVLAGLAVSLILAAVLSRDTAAEAVPPSPPPAAVTTTLPPTATVGMIDPASGRWTLLDSAGNPFSFFYGNPGDIPFVGDWDCDGVDTPGLYRQSDGFAYLRNTNTQGNADITFFLGNPGDVPLAGDFNADGCDTLSVYRPGNQTFYIADSLGSSGGGFIADYSFLFGNPGDKPVVGDWDGDGIDEVGLHRETSGFFYWRNTLDTGIASDEIFFGDPNDRFIAGDWGIVDGIDTPAIFRPTDSTFYFRHTLTQGIADSTRVFGESTFLPVAGRFDGLTRTVSVAAAGAPEDLRVAVEQFYLRLENTPGLPASFKAHLGTAGQQPGTFSFVGNATTGVVVGQDVAVLTFGGDVVLAARTAGAWSVVGAHLPTQGKAAWYGEGPTPGSPRRVFVIGSDTGLPSGGGPADPASKRADAPHILTARAADGKASILSLPRSTLVQTSYGLDGINQSMAKVPEDWLSGGTTLWSPPPSKPSSGPAETTAAVANTLGLPLEGYILVDFDGFITLVDAWSGFSGGPMEAVLPWSSNLSGLNDCPRAGDSSGCVGPGLTSLTGLAAQTWARERTPQLTSTLFNGCDPIVAPANCLPQGGVDRVEGHGSIIRAVAAKVGGLSVLTLPGALSVLDDYVTTDLSGAELLTLGAITWQLPTPTLFLDPSRTVDPSLPNIVLNSCPAEGRSDYSAWTRPAPGFYYTLWSSGRTFFPRVAATLSDFSDGYWDGTGTLYWDPTGPKQAPPDCSAHPLPAGWPVDPTP